MHLVEGPRFALTVLYPFEVRDRDATRIHEDIGTR
jgi:hypothetical protein